MKKGFTLIELLATIVIIGITITIIFIKIDNNLKKVSNLSYDNQISLVEDSAIIYSNEYSNELTNLNTIDVDFVRVSTLISKGLFEVNKISDLNSNGYVVIANINGNTNVKYSETITNIIFLIGENYSLNVGDTYTELGGYVAVQGTGLVQLTNSNISSTVNTSQRGTYDVTYSYTNAPNVIRKVTIN